MKILIVDDDPDILHLCSKALANAGHEIVGCEGGQKALRAALLDRFDVALCDINLPDVNGLEIVRAVKMQAPELPVIVMSALDPREWRGQALAAGADHFLQKPLHLDELRDEVEMAGMARSALTVVVCDRDDEHRTRLVHELRRGGCLVRVVDTARDVVDAGPAELVIVDAADPDALEVVRHAAKRGVYSFVLVDAGADDDAWMRAGAGLVVAKPADAEALLIQARFLGAGAPG